MSAFAVIYERKTNTPVQTGVFEFIMQRLSHRGPDGNDSSILENAQLGHWHFWTTPEEKGEKQPLNIPGMPFTIVMDGRLDNRPEVLRALSINNAEEHCMSDAALVLRAYDRWGTDCFAYFVGEFALVIFDSRLQQLVCARDALGDRTLFYRILGDQVMVASEPWAIAADEKPFNPNPAWTAHFFALQETPQGLTPFTDVRELLPASVMVFDTSGERQWTYWSPEKFLDQPHRSNREYAEHFLALLEESVRCRMRSIAPAGVLMSGGLDSTSVASLAARMQASVPVKTISYVYEEFQECDERQYINAVRDQYGINSIQIPCDDLWPYKDGPSWPYNPNWPEGSPYRLIRERAYPRAKAEGLTVLLTGGFGDHLYIGWRDWLADAIRDRRYGYAGKELLQLARDFGILRTLKGQAVRRAARRALDRLPLGNRIHHKPAALPWLTSYAAGLINTHVQGGQVFRYATLAGLNAASGASKEVFYASRYGIELRHPYRDRRLIEFVIGLPAYLFYSEGMYKIILRDAMRGILPEIIRTRRQATSLVRFFSTGVRMEHDTIEKVFNDPSPVWADFVDIDWVRKHWNVEVKPETDGPVSIIPWICYSNYLWNQKNLL